MPVDYPKILFASSNHGKFREASSILKGIPHSVIPIWEFDEYSDPDETGETYCANAMIKAVSASEALGLPALADDSGLEVDALDGRPGVQSRRFGGGHITDQEKYTKLIGLLRDVPYNSRTARFICSVVLVNGSKLIIESRGEVEGIILNAPSGRGGFGYDPVFWIPSVAKTMAELDFDQKNTISHRGRALRGIKDFLLRNPDFLDRNARL